MVTALELTLPAELIQTAALSTTDLYTMMLSSMSTLVRDTVIKQAEVLDSTGAVPGCDPGWLVDSFSSRRPVHLPVAARLQTKRPSAPLTVELSYRIDIPSASAAATRGAEQVTRNISQYLSQSSTKKKIARAFATNVQVAAEQDKAEMALTKFTAIAQSILLGMIVFVF